MTGTGLREGDVGSGPSPGGDVVCWSRMQAEAGQDLAAIVARKEAERRYGAGVFLWGVGTSPGTAAADLARAGARPPVVFSVMRTRPKRADVAPAAVFAWRVFVGCDGRERPLPEHAIVTSKGDAAGTREKDRHYALVCFAADPLALGDHGPFDPSAYRNVGGRGAPVGASQVTALLRRVAPDGSAGDYRVSMRAVLTGDLWVRLRDPVELDAAKLAALRYPDAYTSPDLWRGLARWLRERPARPFPRRRGYQPALL